MRLHTNVSALRADTIRRQNNKARSESAEKLASGYRINRAADDPAGLAISQRKEAQSRGLDVNQRNIQDGKSLLDTADGAMGDMQDAAQRMRELTVQAGNDTLVEKEREAIREEMRELEDEIGAIAKETEFNNMPLLDGTFSERSDPVEDRSSPNMRLPQDGTPVSDTLEMGRFEVDFEFSRISEEEVRVDVKSEGTHLGSEIIEYDPINWEKQVGGSDIDLGADVALTDDGGFIAVGTTASDDVDVEGASGDNNNIFLARHNEDGDLLWTETFRDEYEAEGVSISRAQSGDEYIISGTTASDAGDGEIILRKIKDTADEVNGVVHGSPEEVFTETYGGQDDYGKSIYNVENGGKILAGDIDGKHGNQDILLLKLDENGIYKWEKHIENKDSDDIVHDVKSDNEGNYVVAAQQEEEAVMHRISENSEELETAELGYTGPVTEVESLENGGYITVGYEQDESSIEVVRLDENLNSEASRSIEAESEWDIKKGLGLEALKNNGDNDFIISATTTAEDGTEEKSAIRLDEDLDTVWKTYEQDFGSHGNKGDIIRGNPEGDYLVAIEDENQGRVAQFDSEGIYDWEIDFNAEIDDIDDFDITEISTGEESYYTVLNDGDDGWHLVEMDFDGEILAEEDISSEMTEESFTDIHLLNEGNEGLAIVGHGGDDTKRIHRYDENLNSLWSESVGEGMENIEDVTITEEGLALVGSSRRGELTVTAGEDNIYNDIEVHFESGNDEDVVYDHDSNELKVTLEEGVNYTTGDVEELLHEKAESEDVITYYDGESLSDIAAELDDDFSGDYEDTTVDNIFFDISNNDLEALSSFDLDGEEAALESENSEAASGEIEVGGVTLTITGNSAFQAGEEINIVDNNNGEIDESITFSEGDGDIWNINVEEYDDVFSQTEAMADIIDDELAGHEANYISETNELEINETEGDATGTDIEITTGDGELVFEVDENSTAEEQGEYEFELTEEFTDGDIIEIDGESFAYHSETGEGDFAGDELEDQADSLADAVGELERWNGDETIGDGNTVTLIEAEGEATGEDISDEDIVIREPEGEIGEVSESEASIPEQPGDYDLEITDAFEANENLKFEYNDQVWNIDFVENGSNAGHEIDVNEYEDTEAQAGEIANIIEEELENHTVETDESTIEIEEEFPADGKNLSITEGEDKAEFLDDEYQESIEAQAGEYGIDIEEPFTDGDILIIDETRLYYDSEGEGDFSGDEIADQAESLAEALGELDRWDTEETTSDDEAITLVEDENEITGEEPDIEVQEPTGEYNHFDTVTGSVEEVQGEYSLTVGNNEDYEGLEVRFEVEEELDPGDEEEVVSIEDDNTLVFRLAQDIELEEFEIASDVAFEADAENWDEGEPIEIDGADGEEEKAAGSDLYENGLDNLWMAELNDSGDLEEEEIFGGSGNEEGHIIQKLDDGGYILLGNTNSDNGDLENVGEGEDSDWIIELNEDKEIEWQETDDITTANKFDDIVQVDEREFLLFEDHQGVWTEVYSLKDSENSWEVSLKNSLYFAAIQDAVKSRDSEEILVSGATSYDNLQLFNIDNTGDDLWQKEMQKDSSASSIAQLDDNSVVIAGQKELLSGDNNGVLKRIDQDDGSIIWETQIFEDHANDVELEDIQTTADGENLIVTGMLNDEMVIYELNAETGDYNWHETYEGLSSLQIDEADDGNYVITGHREMQNQDELYDSENTTEEIFDMTVLKVDGNDGEPIWRQDYGADNESAGNVYSTEAGGYLAVGTKTSYTDPKFSLSDDADGEYDPDKDIAVIKVAEDGQWQWDVDLGADDLDEEGIFIQDSYDAAGNFDGYIVAGIRETEEGEDLWAVKLDESGEQEWERTYGSDGDDTVSSVKSTEDGGFVFSGSRAQENNSDLWALKLDGSGDEEWQTTFGGSGDDRANYIEQTHDGGYILTGSSTSEDVPNAELEGEEGVFIVRLNGAGEIDWSDMIGGVNVEEGSAIKEHAPGRYYLTGSTSSDDDGDVGPQPAGGSDTAMWNVSYNRDVTTAEFTVENEPKKPTSIGTGHKLLDIEEARVEFDWEDSEIVGIEAEGEERREAKFGVQVGPNSNQKVLTRIENVTPEKLGFEEGWLEGDFSDEEFLGETLTTIDDAIEKLSSARAEIGAFTNRLEHALNNAENYQENLEAARSRIEDVDVAKEMLKQTRTAIIDQAVTSMLAQANAQPQTVLQLLNTGTV